MNNNNEITYTSWKNEVHPIWATSPSLFPIEAFFINAQMLVFNNDLLHVAQVQKHSALLDSWRKIMQNEYKILEIPSQYLSE